VSSEADAPASLILSLDGFEGPLDLLLDLARAQKLDLGRISIVSLVDQYLAVLQSVALELAADWLVMAAWLAWLKSRLLLPADDPAAEAAEQAADGLAARLAELARMRAGAAWLGARPQLGQEVFPRGAPVDFTLADRSRLVADMPALMRGYVEALRRVSAQRVYRPRQLSFWTVQDALGRMAATLGAMPPWSTLEAFLPDLLSGRALKAAVASTLIASLEMARTGSIVLRQDAPFAPILVARGEA
jgi:segregation and condensation protein A